MRTSSRLFSLPFFAALALGLCLTTAPAAAQYFGRNKVQYDDFDFKKIDTEHFEIYFYPEERQAVSDVARMAERWYLRHSQTFLRQFDEKKPLIFYANDADFQQTNVIGGLIGQGTGGVTESLKERVVMPLTGSYAENDHVLGHELVHSFQYDIGLRNRESGFQLQRLPLWLVEGMAEYLSVGRNDSHTAMWLRDYALRDDLPTIEQLTRDFSYFPYRFGQAYMAYVGGKYGDAAVANLFKLSGRVGVDSAFVYALGITTDSLSAEWKEAVRETYLPQTEGRTLPSEAGNVVLGQPGEEGQLNISPSVSPDGNFVAFISRRNIFTTNLFIADTETGEVLQELRGTAANPHFDALRFINSAGSWSPDGERFAFVTFVEGDNEINIIDAESGRIEERIKVQGVSAITNPAWSPNGQQIAFSGLNGGISDLYVMNIETREVRQLTNDRYADLQPAWAPDGRTLAFTTDRGPDGTDFEALSFAETRLGLIDVASRDIQVLRPFGNARHHNPQYAPDGGSLFFVSDQDGFKDVYRYDLDAQRSYRVTNLATGVSGISASSPTMSVASQSGRMMFTVFSNGGYSVFSLGPDETQGEPVEPLESGIPTAAILPPIQSIGSGLVADYLSSPLEGLPAQTEFEADEYSAGLRLDYVAPPSGGIGVTTGGGWGTRAGVGGGVGFFFSDMLGNRNLTVVAQANGTFKDIGGQAAYLNRKHRINYGASVGHIPILTGGFAQLDFNNFAQVRQRLFITQASLLGAYPLTTTRRFELDAGVVRYGFDSQVRICNRFGGCTDNLSDSEIGQISPDLQRQLAEPDPLYFFQGGAAYVGDFSYFGFTSPVQGGRYRIGVSPRVGTFTFTQALLDYRRYFFADPVTFAVRGMHIGNYGIRGREGTRGFQDQDPNLGTANFTQEYLGAAYYPGFIRGYSFNSFDNDECSVANCQVTDARLRGTRIAMASAEVRLPFLGTEQFGLLNFPYLPTELTLFTDAGVAWTSENAPVFEFVTDTDRLNGINDNGTPNDLSDDFTEFKRYPVVSMGAAARFNVLGALIFEVFYAYPFQRPERGGHFGAVLTPGW